MYSAGQIVGHELWFFDNEYQTINSLDMNNFVMKFEKMIPEMGGVRFLFERDNYIYLVFYLQAKIVKFDKKSGEYFVFRPEFGEQGKCIMYVYAFMNQNIIRVYSFYQEAIHYSFNTDNDSFEILREEFLIDDQYRARLRDDNEGVITALLHSNRIEALNNQSVILSEEIQVTGIGNDFESIWITDKKEKRLLQLSKRTYNTIKSYVSEAFNAENVNIFSTNNFLIFCNNENNILAFFNKQQETIAEVNLTRELFKDGKEDWKKINFCIEQEENIILLPWGLVDILVYNKKDNVVEKLIYKTKFSKNYLKDNFFWKEDDKIGLSEFLCSIK